MTTIPNWAALHAPVISETEMKKRKVPRCEACALYIEGFPGFKVPELRGLYCSILCVECGLFGKGRCRWCGSKTDNRFCGEACAKTEKRHTGEFGDGHRLLSFLRAHYGALAVQVCAETRRCKECDGILDPAMRNDAMFCGDRCRMANHRKEGAA